MKSLRKVFFIAKKCGFGTAIFYLYYSIELGIINWVTAKRDKDETIPKMYAVLFQLDNETIRIENIEYIKTKLAEEKYVYLKTNPDSSDILIFKDVIINGEYKDVVSIYNRFFMKPAKYIIDCGCNIGLTSIYFSLSYPEAKFLCIEPFKTNADSIKLNFDSVGLKNFTLLQGGVWDKNSSLFINHSFRDGKEWSISLSETGNIEDEIPAYSLVDLVKNFNSEIDILKIDIEGAETELFKDPEFSKQFLTNVKCLAIEIHDEFNIRDTIYEALVKNNFFYYDFADTTVAINKKYI